MSQVTTEENWITTPDGHKLYAKAWLPAKETKARLLLVHGFSDHCNFYQTFCTKLASKGIKVYSFDQRGWGRSVHDPKQRGLTGPTSQVLEDITTVIRSLPSNEGTIPLFIFGHSMGGAEALVYAATDPHEIVSNVRGILLEAPWIALPPGTEPWRITVMLGSLAGKLMPHAQLERKLEPKFISRDPEVCSAWAADPLCHDMGTLGGLAGALERAENLEKRKVVLKEGLGEGGRTRIWIGHGTGDKVTSYKASRDLFEALQVEDKEFKTYEGWFHKLHEEPGDDKITFANDVAKWILDRSGPLPATNDPRASKM